MTTAQSRTRTPEQIAAEAIGDHIGSSNWSADTPWSFDDAVFEAANHLKRTSLSGAEDRVLIAYIGLGQDYRRTLEALDDRQVGAGAYSVAQIIVAMYRLVKVNTSSE